MAIFTVLIAAAFVFDHYFESDTGEAINAESKSDIPDPGLTHVYWMVQTNPVTIKSVSQKSVNKRFFLKSHDKFVQKYHQLRNYQVFKAEVIKQTEPLISHYHHLIFKCHHFSFSDDEDPLV